MDKFVIDQAEGLRRLLAREGSRVVAVTSGPGSPGRTTTVVNLAAALTEQGRDVLVIDECLGPQSVCALLGAAHGAGNDANAVGNRLAANFAAVMRGEMALADAAPRLAPGFSVLAAPRANAALYANAQFEKVLAGPADVVLIDTQLDADGALSPLALHAHDVLVVMRVGAQSITDTYACLKRLHFMHAIAQFRVLANHVSSPADAAAALDNLAGVASRYLYVALESAGCIAADPHMARALQLGRPIVDAFASAAAARDFRRLADDLPHWPMRPASAPRVPPGARPAQAADAAPGANTAVTTETAGAFAGAAGIGPASTPGHAGWRADAPAQRRTTHHA